jgi:hypothetical protein
MNNDWQVAWEFTGGWMKKNGAATEMVSTRDRQAIDGGCDERWAPEQGPTTLSVLLLLMKKHCLREKPRSLTVFLIDVIAVVFG